VAKNIVVVGGGLSGTAVAIRLLRGLDGPANLVVYEPSGELGRGIAYGTECKRHLLNVRAGGMSLFPEEPEDFTNWLQTRATDLASPLGKQFVPRMMFRGYVQDRLREAVANKHAGVEFHVIPKQLEKLSQNVFPDELILALGNQRPRLPHPLISSERVLSDPWKASALAELAPNGTVLIIGAGLTMIDVVLQLREKGFIGKIIAMSRRGLLPHVHSEAAPNPQDLPPHSSALGLLRHVSRNSRNVDVNGDWRSVVDGLRPHNQTLWSNMALHEKRRFMRHLQTYWDVHRHRIAPAISDAIQSELSAGTLELIAGHVVRATELPESVELEIRTRAGELRTIKAQAVVNCTGPSGDWKGNENPLIEQLVDMGVATYDELGMGLAVDDQCQVRGNSDRIRTFALGPVTKGTFWESTAVPEIRVQARLIADKVLAGQQ
jgi:uncharacterized NAD(P)/FAD-binding protein YdhS